MTASDTPARLPSDASLTVWINSDILLSSCFHLVNAQKLVKPTECLIVKITQLPVGHAKHLGNIFSFKVFVVQKNDDVPGIIKQLSCAMTFHILNDHPEYTATQAITESHKMMNGHKWNLFVLYLSFIGWDLLSVLTLGILEIVYVVPYKKAAVAGFYESIKGE